jgi:hypothetical protein
LPVLVLVALTLSPALSLLIGLSAPVAVRTFVLAVRTDRRSWGQLCRLLGQHTHPPQTEAAGPVRTEPHQPKQRARPRSPRSLRGDETRRRSRPRTPLTPIPGWRQGRPPGWPSRRQRRRLRRMPAMSR